MSKRYDEAAREARQRVKAAGLRDLEELKRRYPVGTAVLVGEGHELKHQAYVRGHELNTYYKPLVVTTEGVYYRYEVEDCEDCEGCSEPREYCICG